MVTERKDIRHSTATIILFLSVPLLIFAAVVGTVTLRHFNEMSVAMGMAFPTSVFLSDLRIIIGAFIICLALEGRLFIWALTLYREKADALERIAREQERAAQLLVSRDLELTRANEQLRSLDEVKSEFISVVAHQLRTPLSGIKWTLNLLQNGDLGHLSAEQKKFLAKAYESNDRMIGLVNDLLGADRIDSGKARYLFAPLDITEMIESVLYEVASQAKTREVAISFKKPPVSLPPVQGDAERLRAVLQNLLENAVKYSRPEGSIALTLSVEKEMALVSIKDNGIGIPKDEQEHIFSRFFRAKNAVKVETDGSGLGLYIAKAIIERHGGKIWFEGKENEGVTFSFTIPLAK